MIDTNTETMTATDANGRKIALRAMDPADLLDVLEWAGSAASNEVWLRYATIVCSVTDVDDVPVPRPRDKDGIKRIARQLGNAGMAAVTAALFGVGAAWGVAYDAISEVP